MGLLTRSLSRAIKSTEYLMPRRWDLSTTATGQAVTTEGALSITAVYSCIRLLSETVASLPLFVYRPTANGDREPARDDPFYELLHDSPNPYQTSYTWRETAMVHLTTWGNAYSEIMRVGDDRALVPLSPTKMELLRVDGRLVYRYDSTRDIEADDMLHIRGLSTDGLIGLSPIQQHREAIGLYKAAEAYGAALYRNQARPAMVLTTPKTLRPEMSDKIAAQMDRLRGSDNAGRTVVLEEGMTFEPIGMPADDAQYIECVVPETMLTMADGTLRRADEIRVGDLVLGWDDETDRLVPSVVAGVGDNGSHPLVRVTTDRGRTLTTTENHPYLASPRQRCEKCGRRHQAAAGWPQSWIRADALQVGDYVRVGMDAAVDGPMDRQTGWMLGALIGDGHLRSTGSVGFAGIDAGVLARMGESADAIGASMHDGHGADHYFRGNGYGPKNRMRAFLAEHGVADKNAHTKTVPETVMSGGREAAIGFLSGLLDTDGTVAHLATSQPHVRWDSVSYDLLRESQHLLSSLGVQSALSVKHSTYKGAPWVGYQLQVSGRAPVAQVAGLLEPAHDAKRERLASWVAQMPAARQHPDFFRLDRIRSIELLPASDTVAIEVEGTNSHVTNGLITHNTRKFQVAEIARIFGVPPHMIGDVERSTSWGTGIEQQTMGFLKFVIGPWLHRFEQEINTKLLGNTDLHAEFVDEGLLRTDIETRYKAYQIGRNGGWLSANEIRRWENLSQRDDEGGDEYLLPLNVVSVGEGNEPEVEPTEERRLRVVKAMVDPRTRESIVTAEQVMTKKAQLEAAGEPAGVRSIARALSVSPTTVHRRLSEWNGGTLPDTPG